MSRRTLQPSQVVFGFGGGEVAARFWHSAAATATASALRSWAMKDGSDGGAGVEVAVEVGKGF